MQIHQLHTKLKRKGKKRIGRGGKHGTYSGKGIKGQKSRAGARFQPAIRVFIKRYPKKRGYKFKSILPQALVLNIEILEKKFKKDEKVSPETLLKLRLIRKIKNRMPIVKILGRGRLTKSLIVENCKVSKQAKEKIEKAGGKVELKAQSAKVKTTAKNAKV